jgi:hypothetical protein
MFCGAFRHKSHRRTGITNRPPTGSHLRTGNKAGMLSRSSIYRASCMLIATIVVELVVLSLISAFFYRRGDSLPLRQRLAGSAHALLFAVTVPYGLAIDAFATSRSTTVLEFPILVCVFFGAASMLYSFWAFRAQPVMYLVHIITIVVAVPAVFLASVAVVGWT